MQSSAACVVHGDGRERSMWAGPSAKWPQEEGAPEGWTRRLVWWEASSLEECVVENTLVSPTVSMGSLSCSHSLWRKRKGNSY